MTAMVDTPRSAPTHTALDTTTALADITQAFEESFTSRVDAPLVAVTTPCREYDAELWFAEQTQTVELAKRLCRGCPIMSACLAGALQRREPWGVWGGEVLVEGIVVAKKRGRGRPRKLASSAA